MYVVGSLFIYYKLVIVINLFVLSEIMFCLGTGPILLWFMVGSQQTHFQAGSERIQTGIIKLLGCQ